MWTADALFLCGSWASCYIILTNYHYIVGLRITVCVLRIGYSNVDKPFTHSGQIGGPTDRADMKLKPWNTAVFVQSNLFHLKKEKTTEAKH